MMIKCPNCSYSSTIDDDKISDQELNVKCPKCQSHFTYKNELAHECESETFCCPNCNAEQIPSEVCVQCGLIFAKYRRTEQPNVQITNQAIDQKTSLKQQLHPPFLKRQSSLVALMLVGIIAVYFTWGGLQKNAHSVSNTAWQYDLRNFKKGQQRDELQAMFVKDGYRVQCFEKPGIKPDDASYCQLHINEAWGIPATQAVVSFGQDKGLNSILLILDPDQYPAITQQLDKYGRRLLESEKGKDSVQFDAWSLENGQILSSSTFRKNNGIAVLWENHKFETNSNSNIGQIDTQKREDGSPGSSKTSNIESSGNIASTNEIGCIKSNLSNRLTPVDLYSGVKACLNNENYRDGAFICALAGVYGRYDTFRVSDSTAHQAVALLQQQALGTIDKSKTESLKSELNKISSNPSKLQEMCLDIKRIGSPNYHPLYMIQHGMKAFTGGSSNDGLVENFDASNAWIKTLNTYLHCPKD